MLRVVMEELPHHMVVWERLLSGAIIGLLPMLVAWHNKRSTLAKWSLGLTVVISLTMGFYGAASFALAVTLMVTFRVLCLEGHDEKAEDAPAANEKKA